MGRKRAGFADVQTTKAAFEAHEARCPKCGRRFGPEDKPAFVATFAGVAPTLGSLTCGRCKTLVSIRFVETA